MKRKDKQKVIPLKPNTTKYATSASKYTAGTVQCAKGVAQCAKGVAQKKTDLYNIQAPA